MSDQILFPLTMLQELRLRKWARENYVPAARRRDSDWHPVVLDEMRRIDAELGSRRGERCFNDARATTAASWATAAGALDAAEFEGRPVVGQNADPTHVGMTGAGMTGAGTTGAGTPADNAQRTSPHDRFAAVSEVRQAAPSSGALQAAGESHYVAVAPKVRRLYAGTLRVDDAHGLIRGPVFARRKKGRGKKIKDLRRLGRGTGRR